MSSLLLHPQLSDCRRIFIDDLEVQASIGFHDFERRARQRVKISVALFVPVAESLSNRDDVQDTLDYDKLREGIGALATSRHFNL
ncbi:MAG: dihydroneopterin aldolase, partial [Betaproteobacteria bacterium]|nr:dihydroneopterin aldolase [Betaproteobacteria bacterium]